MTTVRKPTNVDAQRMLNVLDELKERVSFFSVCTPQVIEALKSDAGRSVSDTIGADFVRKLQEHALLQENYITANTNDEGVFKKPPVDDLDGFDDEDSFPVAFRRSVRDVVKKIDDNPPCLEELRSLQESRPQMLMTFMKTLSELQDVTYKRLSRTFEENRSREELVKSLTISESENIKKRDSLQEKLEIARKQREELKLKNENLIAQLKAELSTETSRHQAEFENLKKASQSRMQSMQEDMKNFREKNSAEKEILTKELFKMKENFFNEEEGLKKQKSRREIDIETIVKKYENDKSRLTADLSEQELMYKKEMEELTKLRAHFKRADAEADRVAAELELGTVRTRKMKQNKERLDSCASLLQAFWRGVIQREEYAKLRKSSKKGKKSKK